MSPPPPTLNPSQTVERIREIIVGRHLERLEGRVARLESNPVAHFPSLESPVFEDRLLITEAKVEALQEHVQRIEEARGDTLQIAAAHREEAQRLAAQIQEMARMKADSSSLPAVENLERKLGVWLTDWQKSLHVRLDSRDQQLAGQVNSDLAELKGGIESRLSVLESRITQVSDEGLGKIALAARALADSVSSFTTLPTPKA